MSDIFAFIGGPLVFFYGIAILSSVLLVIQLLMTVFGFDAVEGLDDVEFGANVISFRSLTGFFGGFGWTAVVLLGNGWSLSAATVAGIGVGLVFMFVFAYMMRILYGLKESGNIDLQGAVGTTATVYVSIPPEESGTGQVRVMVQGRLKVFDARTKSSSRIPADRRVVVEEMIGPRTLMVGPLESAIGTGTEEN